MSFEPGERLGRYEIVARSGAGAMGEVYRARDTRLDRIVAIKVISAGLAQDDEARSRFEQEARTIAALNDPHICTIHDVGRHGDADYLVLEYSKASRWTSVSIGRQCCRSKRRWRWRFRLRAGSTGRITRG